MSSSEPTVFVCSASGYQGGALARKLREMGWNVHATTRDLSSPAAVALKNIGVHLNECDWDNSSVLEDTIKGCDKLFLCLLPDWDDPTRERRQCQTILSIAKKVGVKQVVASTTLGVSQLDANVRVYPGSFMEKHMLNKKSIEQAVQDHDFDHFTFLRPTFFMANFLEPKVKRYAEIRDQRSWTTSMTDETQLPILDHVDIAKFAVAAFQDPEAFHGRAIGLASDQMRIQEMLDLLADAAGQPGSIRAHFMTDEEIEAQAQGTGFANTHKVLRTASDYVNLEELRAIAPLTSFRDFLEREKEAVKRTYPL
ncbi:putative NmrA-like family domain-containing protein 1 [Pyrenochaeta sp. MPI-SDFR-AT-0127]|nr:putative NmrA-like family domain-containing protein 1 [Pyrenochaeta sp. MPI-SDFR-AT-0127]